MPLTKEEMGIRIKLARKEKSRQMNYKYTQIMLANDLDLSQGYIGDIESGRTYPTYKVLSSICELCNLSLSYFDK